MKTTPEFTDAEIHEMMDFSQVLSLTEAARRRSKIIVRRLVATVLISGLVGGALFLYNRSSSSDPGTGSSAPSGYVAGDASPSSVPPTTDQQAASLDSAQQSTNVTSTEPPAKNPAQEPLTAKKKNSIVEEKKETPSSIKSDSTVSVFLPAEPIDGYTALYDYFAKQLRYPEQAMKDSIQGVTSVTFIINAQGKPEHVTTDHALPAAFDEEAIRLIQNMPAWKPAQLDGAPVKSKLSVPITFTLKTTRQQ